jgi:protein O-GlcNAc transferase
MKDINNQLALSKEQIDSVIALYSNSKYQEAIDQIIVLDESYPNVPLLFNIIGACYKELGQLELSAKMFDTAVSIKPNYAEAHKNLGITLRDLGRLDSAVEGLKRAIEVEPNYVDAHYNLAITYNELGQYDLAIDCYEIAIAINPNFAAAHNNYGNVLKSLGKNKAAANSYEKAIAINPNFAEAHSNLGNALRSLKKREKALVCFERAKEINSDMDFILGDILNSKMQLCIWDDLPKLLEELIKKINKGENVIAPFPLLPMIDDPVLLRKNTEFFANKMHPKSHILPKLEHYSKHKKIRIGYFSADFREHPVATLTAELYEVHDRNHFEIYAFSFGPDTKDKMNLRIKTGVDHFHDVRSMSHKELALFARSLEIDIAIDLAGFTAEARMDVFAMSAAPIQLIYMFLGTMGMDYYDYLIASPIMIPKENQKHFVEKIVYLPSYLVNDSKEIPPEIIFTRKDLGLPEKGFVFCCFNNTYKLTPSVFDSWARIVTEVEGSVLLIFTDNETTKLNLTKEIVRRNVEADRIIFGEHLPRVEYLARYRVADLFLDTRPCNAGTTASDALRMGLPVLTCSGKSFNSMEAASIMHAINLPEMITSSPEEYESLAIKLAKNPDQLKIIKDKLDSNLSTAPLYDTKLFAKNLESAYKIMYERHHQGLEPDHIYVEQ